VENLHADSLNTVFEKNATSRFALHWPDSCNASKGARRSISARSPACI
jgi:hypothetical protein